MQRSSFPSMPMVRVPSVLKVVHSLLYCTECTKEVDATKSTCQCSQGLDHPMPLGGEAKVSTMKLVLYWHNVPTVNGYPERETECAACQIKVQPFYHELHLCEMRLNCTSSRTYRETITPHSISYYIEQSEDYIKVKCERCGNAYPRPSFLEHMCE